MDRADQAITRIVRINFPAQLKRIYVTHWFASSNSVN